MSIVQRVYPAEGAQLEALTMHCDHARYVYNLGLEQRSCWTQSRRHFRQKITIASQMRDLTEARREFDWLRAGSSPLPDAPTSLPAVAGTRRSRNGPVPGRDSSYAI